MARGHRLDPSRAIDPSKIQPPSGTAVVKPHPIRARLADETHGVDVWRHGSGAVIQVLRRDLKDVLNENDELVAELLKTREERDKLKKQNERVSAVLKDVRDNYDHDEDAHRYGTLCRCCEAEKALKELT